MEQREMKNPIRTVELIGTGTWKDYIEEVVQQSTDEERISLYGIESNTETEEGDYIVEIREELVGATLSDYYKYCSAGDLTPSVICAYT